MPRLRFRFSSTLHPVTCNVELQNHAAPVRVSLTAGRGGSLELSAFRLAFPPDESSGDDSQRPGKDSQSITVINFAQARSECHL